MIPIEKGKSYQKDTTSQALIRFQDCDPLKHLNNAKYFDYFFNAREDQISRLYDFSPADLFKTYQTGWVVYQHQIAYVRPALVGEWVSITSRIVFHDHNTLVVEYVMTDKEQKQLKTVLWSTMKYVNAKTGKATAHQPDVQLFLDAIAHQNLDISDFNGRIKSIKMDLRY